MSRPVWYIQVVNLDHSCSPNLPPSANIKEYSAEQLRRIAIEAVRIRNSWTSCRSRSSCLERKDTILRNPTASEESSLPPKLFPGGRFLVVLDSRTQLRVIDLHDSGRAVWVYDISSDSVSEPVRGAMFYAYDVCMLEDGSLVLAYHALIGEVDGLYE